MSASKNDQVGLQVYGRYYVCGITNNTYQKLANPLDHFMVGITFVVSQIILNREI